MAVTPALLRARARFAVPFELADNHIYVRVAVNGSPPRSFILDSGASGTILSLRNAQSFGMALQRMDKVETGIGENPPDVYRVTDTVTFSLPGLVFSDDGALAIPLDRTQECLDSAAKKETSRPVDGILGQDFLSAVVVEIDFPARLINVYAPGSYEYTGSGDRLPLEMESQFLFVRVQVKAPSHPPATARLVVDTGSGTALSLTRQFAEAHRVLLPSSKLTPAVECGVAGASKDTTLVGKLELLQLGALKLSKPVTVFYQRTAERWYDGLLGTPALLDCRVIFDCTRGRMIVERSRPRPNGRLAHSNQKN